MILVSDRLFLQDFRAPTLSVTRSEVEGPDFWNIGERPGNLEIKELELHGRRFEDTFPSLNMREVHVPLHQPVTPCLR